MSRPARAPPLGAGLAALGEEARGWGLLNRQETQVRHEALVRTGPTPVRSPTALLCSAQSLAHNAHAWHHCVQ